MPLRPATPVEIKTMRAYAVGGIGEYEPLHGVIIMIGGCWPFRRFLVGYPAYRREDKKLVMTQGWFKRKELVELYE